MVSHWQLTTCLGGPATALICFEGEGLTGVVVVVESTTAFHEGGFPERSVMSPGTNDND